VQTVSKSGRAVVANNYNSRRRFGAIFDDELPQFRMIRETAVAAVTKIRADLADVTSSDFGAAQSAISLNARRATIDH
jgi:hypothetical protein